MADQNDGTAAGGNTNTGNITTTTGGGNTTANTGGNTGGNTANNPNNSGNTSGNNTTANTGNTGDNKAGGAGGDGATKGGNTILEGGAADKTATVQTKWPDNWRDQAIKDAGISPDDKAAMAMLERLTAPGDMAKKLVEQEKLIRQGGHKVTFPKEGTHEQQAAWRKDNGIPEAPDKYDLALPDGLLIGEADKPIVDNMLATMHGMNLNNEQVKQVLASYYAQEKEFLASRDADIATNKTSQEDALHADWGNEFRPNLNAISALTKTFSQETRTALSGAMDSDGFPLLNNKNFLKDMALLARTINPIDHVPMKEGGTQMASVDDEIKAIEARIGLGKADPLGDYYKDTKAQERLRQLYDWRERQKKA